MKGVDSERDRKSDVEFHSCEVHRLVDKDSAPRLCKWCNACRAWICADCWHSPKRIGAFMARLFEKEGAA